MAVGTKQENMPRNKFTNIIACMYVYTEVNFLFMTHYKASAQMANE